MTVYKIPSPSNSANELLLTAAAETRLRTMSSQADQLLQDMNDSDPVTSKLLHGEAVRLFSACVDIVRLLAAGDIDRAYRVSVGEANEGGDVLGVAV